MPSFSTSQSNLNHMFNEALQLGEIKLLPKSGASQPSSLLIASNRGIVFTLLA